MMISYYLMFKSCSSKMYILLILSLINLGQTKDCYLSCDDVQTTYNKNLCFENCNHKIILGYTLGGGAALLLLVLFICCCKYNRYRCLWYIKRKIRRQYDGAVSENIKFVQMEKEQSLVSKALKNSQNSNIFSFFINQAQVQMKVLQNTVRIEKLNICQYKITFSGRDKFDQFMCQGSILHCEDSVRLWFIKQYKYYENVNKVGMEDLLVYHGTLNKTKKMYLGQWESYDERIGEKLSGKWFLSVNQTHQRDRFR